MLKFLVTLRNIMVVIILSWLGFSEAPKDNNAPEDGLDAPSAFMLIR